MSQYTSAMNVNPGWRRRMAAIASSQNGSSLGGEPSLGSERSPQVFLMISGCSSIAMSQRTPSQRCATAPSSAICASRKPAWR